MLRRNGSSSDSFQYKLLQQESEESQAYGERTVIQPWQRDDSKLFVRMSPAEEVVKHGVLSTSASV